ncbi:DUF3972 domain-containing protein [Helicobacter sp. MIT 14-3879]|uniref:DUF3972 domain-containing protein n=1 Tax=Helicobacter sp. MIT 14-3879 TaxID=2040649 RepID=UPI000E1FA345|nr:DUF3972 domain-containing protein [Helicobacter sp. MIT 14-3879]RDU62461.1 DUF3972 domain-containing protein [Helicobacter sp. MIT 14-3879]
MRENWIKIEEFLTITGLNIENIKELITKGQISAKYINNILYVDSVSGTNALVKSTQNTLVSKNIDSDFIEQSIGTILNLHDKVVEAKDETIASIKNENQFLKDSLLSVKESQIEDKKTIENLKLEIENKKQELEAIQRKYKLMWGKMLNKNH